VCFFQKSPWWVKYGILPTYPQAAAGFKELFKEYLKSFRQKKSLKFIIFQYLAKNPGG
jgi:hypothetical protein